MTRRSAGLTIGALALIAGCGGGDLNRGAGGVYAPGPAGEATDNLATGHRLMEARQFDLALSAYTRAAAEQGLDIDTLSAMGSANLALGRLGQSEALLRRAVALDPMSVPAWNNLGVLLMESGRYAEAGEVFRRAYAADSGGSDTIRDNLRLALARTADPLYTGANEAAEVQAIGHGFESSPLTDPGTIEPL